MNTIAENENKKDIFEFSLPAKTTEYVKEKRAIDAQDIVQAIIEEKHIKIDNAVIVGSLSLKYEVIQSGIEIKNTTFKEKFDCSFATFKRNVCLKRSTFKNDVLFVGAKLQADISISGATFEGKTDFSDLTLSGIFYSRDSDGQKTKFQKKVDFEEAVFHRRVEFHKTIFKKEAIFLSIQIRGNAKFHEVEFQNKANFNNSKILGTVFFNAENPEEGTANQPAIFGGLVDFESSTIEGRAKFTDSQFHGNVNFDSAKINGSAFFNRAEFHGNVRFNSAKISGAAFFNNAKFLRKPQSKDEINVDFVAASIEGNAEFTKSQFHGNVSFNSAKINGGALFNNAKFLRKPQSKDEINVNFVVASIEGNAEFTKSQFHGNVSFSRTKINGSAFFDSAKFLRKPQSKDEINVKFVGVDIKNFAKFTYSQFEGNVNFNSARVEGDFLFQNVKFSESKDLDLCIWFHSAQIREVKFTGAKSNSDLHLENTQFKQKVDFVNSSFKTIFFDKEVEPEFKGGVDLRGCTYDRIEPVKHWKNIVKRIEPYDRQPFSQLEATVRSSGDDRLADKIYIEREKRRVDWLKKKKNPGWRFESAKSWFFGILTGYGVQTWRILVCILVLQALGTFFVFQNEGAVQPKDTKRPPFEATSLPLGNSAYFTLDMILPISIQTRSGWEPSYKFWWKFGEDQAQGTIGIRYVDIAAFFNLCGWILVPVGIGGITGLLKRP